MIYLTKIESSEKRGHTALYDTDGKPFDFTPDKFTSLDLQLKLRWDAEHSPLVQDFLNALRNIYEVAEIVDEPPVSG